MREFDYAWDEVHDEAEVLEHAISDRLLSGIYDLLGHPLFDPHRCGRHVAAILRIPSRSMLRSMPRIDRIAQPLPRRLGGKGHDGRRPAHRRTLGRGLEGIGIHQTHARHLLDMTMGGDTAGQHPAPACVQRFACWAYRAKTWRCW